jgi:signal peptidase I
MSTEKTEKTNSWEETVRTVIVAVLLAVIFRSFLFEPFHIPSGSMKNNLLVGDYLFVSKYSYGYSRYSFPLGIRWFDGRIMASDPKRGDIVVFREPSNPSVDFIKRIIGLPGDSVQVKEGIVYINGTALKRERVDDWLDEENGRKIRRFKETLPEGKQFDILKEMKYSVADDTGVFNVPEGHFFMMGDNRDNSRDSRFDEVGFVPFENMVGRADIIFFSVDDTAKIYNPLSWITGLRYGRFLTVIR